MGNATQDCPFCRIITGEMESAERWETETCRVIQPLRPHAPGHVMFVPKRHVRDAGEDDELTGNVFREAAHYANRTMRDGYNLITSSGTAATQSVMHLHVHVVPRGAGDGLDPRWPWGVAHTSGP